MEPLGILAVGKTKSSTLQTCSEIAKVFLATTQGLCVTAVVSVEACVCNQWFVLFFNMVRMLTFGLVNCAFLHTFARWFYFLRRPAFRLRSMS